MSLTDYKVPFTVEPSDCDLHVIKDADDQMICDCMTEREAEQIAAILNAHFTKKEEPMRVTLQPGEGPTPERPPTHNQAETDAVAVKYYESGRKLEVQAWVVGDWTDQPEPNFSSRYPWRIKPSKRRVVVEIWKTQIGDVVSRISYGNPYIAGFKLLGTIEGEVEV